MYFFYKTNDAQVEVQVSEKTFFKAVESNMPNIISLFNSYDDDNYRISPMTKKEGEWMMSTYCQLVSLREPIPKWLLSYFQKCFVEIINGTPVQNALNLANPPHRPAEYKIAERNENIYFDVLELMEQGRTLFDSALELSEKYDLHESNIQKIYSTSKKIKSEISNEDIDVNF